MFRLWSMWMISMTTAQPFPARSHSSPSPRGQHQVRVQYNTTDIWSHISPSPRGQHQVQYNRYGLTAHLLRGVNTRYSELTFSEGSTQGTVQLIYRCMVSQLTFSEGSTPGTIKTENCPQKVKESLYLKFCYIACVIVPLIFECWWLWKVSSSSMALVNPHLSWDCSFNIQYGYQMIMNFNFNLFL